jgi:hypothetical protein
MRSVVLADNRPSLCFTLTMVHAVLRLMPSAFACLSSEVYPDAINASAMCSIPTVQLRCPALRATLFSRG